MSNGAIPAAIGIDAGGTKIAAGLITEQGVVVTEHTRPTPQTNAHDAVDALTAAAQTVLGEAGAAYDVRGIGAGLPGLVDAELGSFAYGPHFPVTGIPVASELEARLGLPCRLENDATAAAWGERIHGAGERADAMIFFTLGTGIGGGIVLDGRLMRGGHGYAGEFGHMTVDHTLGYECSCGLGGCWETVASGHALTRLAKDLIAKNPGRYRELVDEFGATGKIFEPALAAGDIAARVAFDEFTDWVAIGAQNLIQILDPARIVIGGGVSAMGDTLVEPIRAHLRERLSGADHRPEVQVRIATLGPRAGMIGAAALITEPSPL